MPSFDQPMLHGRHYAESHRKDDRAKSAEAEGFGRWAELRKSVLKECLQLESKQHLRPEDEKPRLVEARLQLPVEVAGHPTNLTLRVYEPGFLDGVPYRRKAIVCCGIAARNAFGLSRLETNTEGQR